jgi:DNA-directed RNA polymerase subunit beta
MKKKIFGMKRKLMEVPNLIELLHGSYAEFLQLDADPMKRAPIGLQGVFNEFFPIISADENVVLEFISYKLGESKYSEVEARSMGKTYSAPLLVTIRLIYKKDGEIRDIREQEVFFGDIPLMTRSGTFIFNGAERTIVSQLHRSPGVFLGYDSKKNLYSGRLIPDRGSWLEFEIDDKGIFGVKIDRHKRIMITTFLRALGFEKDEEILSALFSSEKVEFHSKRDLDKIIGRRVLKQVLTSGKELLLDSGDLITHDIVEQLKNEDIKELHLVKLDEYKNSDLIFRSIEKNRKENLLTKELSLKKI